MRAPRTRTLIWIGIVIGLFAGVTLAITFDPGDASKATDGVAFGAPNGMNVTFYGSENITMGDVFPNSSTASSQFANRAVILNTTAGNITLASDNPAWASVHASNLTGTWTNVTEITAGSTWIEIYPSDKQRVDVKGDTNKLSIASMAVDDNTADFYYSGPNNGVATVKLYELVTNTRVVAVDASDGSYLDHGMTDANGNLTLDLPTSDHTVELKTKSSTSTPVHTNPDPTGAVNSKPNQLSIDINDSDFPEDDVEVNISLDGTLLKSVNISSNQTVTASVGSIDLGSHTWFVNTTDAYGNTNSTNYTFFTPSSITLRNESDASDIITDKNITATFYGPDGEIIVERTDRNEDGNISLSGLPNEPFVVTFEGDGWYDRRAYIDSIFNQQDIYLLNSSVYTTLNNTAIETTFVYEDRTGKFPQDETTLQIQRAVDVDDDGNFSYQVVAGDYWGAAGEFPFTGQYQERYRLKITNQKTNTTRILGTHIPVADGVKNIIVGEIIFDAENATGRYWDAALNQNTSNIQAYYQDPTNKTSDLTIKVYEAANHSNVIYNQTFAGPHGEKLVIVSLNSNQTDTNWIVEFDGTHADDGTVHGEIIVGGAGYALPIDPNILAAFGFAMITFVMALYGPRVAIFGSWAGVMVYAGLMFLTWLPVSVPALTIAVIAAAGGTLYKEALP